MDRALSAWRLPALRLDLRTLGIALYVGVNLGLILYQPWSVGFIRDWELWRHVSTTFASPALYGNVGAEMPYVWSPLMAPVVAGIVAAGVWPWAVAHVAAVLFTRDRVFIVLMLCSWGFWTDVAGGNTFTFSVVAGFLALRGSRSGAIVYLALLFLMPRPIQLPMAALLLWRMPEIRLPTLLLGAALTLAAAPVVGMWIRNMLVYATVAPFDLGPRHFIGYVWVPITLPVAAWLMWRGRPGWAGLFASAYWLPQYFLMPLVDLPAMNTRRSTHQSPDQSGR